LSDYGYWAVVRFASSTDYIGFSAPINYYNRTMMLDGTQPHLIHGRFQLRSEFIRFIQLFPGVTEQANKFRIDLGKIQNKDVFLQSDYVFNVKLSSSSDDENTFISQVILPDDTLIKFNKTFKAYQLWINKRVHDKSMEIDAPISMSNPSLLFVVADLNTAGKLTQAIDNKNLKSGCYFFIMEIAKDHDIYESLYYYDKENGVVPVPVSKVEKD